MNRKNGSRIVCAIGVVLAAVLATCAAGVCAGRDHRHDCRGRGRLPGRGCPRRDGHGGPSSRLAPLTKAFHRRMGASCCPACVSADPYKVTATLAGFGTEVKERCHGQPGRGDRHRVQAEGRRGCGRSDRHGDIRSGVQHEPHRRGHGDHARRSGDAADGVGPHHRYHAPEPAVRRQRHVRRPGQPREQHDDRRVVLQRRIRSGHRDRQARAIARESHRSRSRRSSRSR